MLILYYYFGIVQLMTPKDLRRFHGSYIVVLSSGCWQWNGTRRPDGYGQFSYGPAKDRTQYMAHRLAWELEKGPIPEGKVLDHLCRNRACVNPAHLEPVTIGENVLRGEGITAQHKRKTHCKRGHALEGDNLYRAGQRGRTCRTCHIERQMRWQNQNKADRAAYGREYYVKNAERLKEAARRYRQKKASG
jgi:hypothetical protein